MYKNNLFYFLKIILISTYQNNLKILIKQDQNVKNIVSTVFPTTHGRKKNTIIHRTICRDTTFSWVISTTSLLFSD
jgi:hypothetical protein